MWIALIGAPTCKREVALQLASEGFEYVTTVDPLLKNRSPATYNLNLLDQYYRQTIACGRGMDSRNLVTVGSFWSQFLVYTYALRKLNLIDEKDVEISEHYYNKLAQGLKPPSVFIYMKASVITIQDRVKLKEQDQSEEWIEAVRDGHERFVENIRVPVLDIDAAKKYDKIWDDVQFDVAQMKSSKLSDQTLWTRTIFRSGYV